MTEKRTVEIKNLDNSMVEITSALSIQDLEKYEAGALKKINDEISIDGFRKGYIPKNILVKKVGEMTILNQMVEMALTNIYPLIVLENKLEVIGQPQVTITKITPHEPVEFKILSAILPQFELPDYKDIAKKINTEKTTTPEVTEKELSETIMQIQKINQTPPPQPREDKTTPQETIGELTDEFVKTLGDFKDVADFRTKLKENIKRDKENKIQEVKRVKIMEKILAETNIKLPPVIIENETERLFTQTKADITKMGLQFDKYLEHLKKTEEELKKELQPDAEKRAKIQFVLDKIIRKENIKANQAELEKNVKQILEQYKDAKEEQVRSYVEMVLSNQEVFSLLEKQ